MKNELFIANIKEKLREQGGDINSLSAQLGITRQSLHRRLSNNPTWATMEEIADAIGCRLPELLIEPDEQIVSTDCANNEPVISNLIECPNCGTKMYVSAVKDLK
jgi:lambda repressor-like predicted transcriptional regulator